MSQQPYFQNQGSMHSTLSDLLQHMPSTPTAQDLELLWRNHIWQNLHHSNPSQFLPGPNLTAIMEVCNALTNRNHPSCSTTIHCSSCLSLDTLQPNYNFPDFLDHNTFHHSLLLQGVTNLPPFTNWECTTFSNWINGCALVPFNIQSHSFSSHECNICHSIGPFVLSFSFITTPPIIFLDLSNYTTTTPLDWTIHLSGISSAIQYHLFACLYVGSHHFTSCYIDKSNISWTYDGQLHSGHLFPEGPAHNQDLTCLGTQTLCSIGYIHHPLLT